MDQVHVARHKVLVEGRTQRAVARELGLSRTTVIKDAVAEWKRQRREVFVPLTYRPPGLCRA